jgi:vacuole morphology and inheritance protein 14
VAYYSVLQAIITCFELRSKEEAKIAAMEWIALVHSVRPEVIRDHFDAVFCAVLSTLGDPSENVLHKCIETLTLIAGEDRFGYFIQQLLKHIEQKSTTLLLKAPVIIKQLQLRYQGERCNTCEKLFLKIAELLPLHEDKRFVGKLVVVMSYMLLTSKEILPLREVLRMGVTVERARNAFLGLYPLWCYDIVAAISLCLLAAAYSHAHELVVLLGSTEMSPQTLVHLDRLAQLVESPVFSCLRIAMLRPIRHASLVKTLFGIQLILPQTSPQHKSLYTRLKSVSSVAQLELADRESTCEDGDDYKTRDMEQLKADKKLFPPSKWRELTILCERTQKIVAEYEISQRVPADVPSRPYL